MGVKTDGEMTNVFRQNDIVVVSVHHVYNMGKTIIVWIRCPSYKLRAMELFDEALKLKTIILHINVNVLLILCLAV